MGYLSSFQFLKRVFGEKRISGEEWDSWKKRSFGDKSGFTLTELIVVITILSILSVIGFVVMSHESSVARDGKRISDIKTLSESARITSAQLRLLPTPIADSVSLSVSGSFIGYQGFMSLALVNPLGYGSDKIFDPKDNIPYTYRVNQHYDQAQFLAYLENPRFERSIEIAKQSLPSTLPSSSIASLREAIKMSGEDILSGEGFLSKTYAFDTAYALDSSTTDLSSRYPYSAGDRLGIFLSKGSKQPLQNGVSGTGSRDISLSDASMLDIIVGSQGADEYVSTDISTGSLNALKSGTFDEKALLGMNSGTGSNSGGGNNGGSSSGYILTMGEYSLGGSPVYGYVGPNLLSLFGPSITTITAGDLTPKTIGGKTIDSIAFVGGIQYIFIEANSGYATLDISEGSNTTSCTPNGNLGSVDQYVCSSVSVSPVYTPGEVRVLGIESVPLPPVDDTNTCGLTSEEIGELNTLTNQHLGGQAWCNTSSINLSNKGINTLPNGFTKLIHLNNINISNNHLASIPEYFGTFDFMNVTLNAQNNELRTLPDSWGGKQFAAHHLYLSGNPELGFLNRDNFYDRCCSNIGRNEQLGVTTSGGGMMVVNYQSEGYMEIITWGPNDTVAGNECSLTANDVDDLNAWDPNYQRSLDLGYTTGQNFYAMYSDFQDAPYSAGWWCNRDDIRVGVEYGYEPTTFHPLLTKLKHVTEFWWQNMNTELPNEVTSMTGITMIYINNNAGLTTLPTDIGNLTNLGSLLIFNTSLSVIPDSLFNIPSLRWLAISNHNAGEGTNPLTSLNGQLTSIPDSIGNALSLENLSIGGQGFLTTLPESLGNLDFSDGDLFLTDNNLSSLPDSFSGKTIGRLGLSGNSGLGNLAQNYHFFYNGESFTQTGITNSGKTMTISTVPHTLITVTP